MLNNFFKNDLNKNWQSKFFFLNYGLVLTYTLICNVCQRQKNNLPIFQPLFPCQTMRSACSPFIAFSFCAASTRARLTALAFLTAFAPFWYSCQEPVTPTSTPNPTTQTPQGFTDFRVFVEQGNQLVRNPAVFDRDIRDFVYACLRDMYYWEDKVSKTLVPTSFSTPEAVLEAGMVRPEDRQSYIVKDGSAFLRSLSSGESTSYGLSVKFLAPDDLRVALVENNSPAAAAGLKRGMKILRVNGGTLRAFEGVAAFGAGNFPSLTLEVQDMNATDQPITTKSMMPATFNRQTVLRHSITTVGGKKVAYLLFTSFTASAIGELEEVFTKFHAEGVTEMVLDLRYNGGGSVATCQRLVSLLASQLNGTTFLRQAHNARYSILDSEEKIEFKPNGLQLKRLFVIITNRTASASEIVINGLKPHIEVITIGSPSFGKNTGSYVVQHQKSDYVVAIVNFLSKNSLGDSNFGGGFVPTRYEEDDVRYDFGDPRERSYAAAIEYISKGAFPVLTAKRRAEIAAAARYPLIRDDKFLDIPLLVKELPARFSAE
jgi:C-terminal processing protease CtpA/Prc